MFIHSTMTVSSLSCHEGIRDRNGAGIEAANPVRDRQLRFQLHSGREHPRDMTNWTLLWWNRCQLKEGDRKNDSKFNPQD
eukprot:gene3173-biopygen11886